MQETRRQILEILKDRGDATVDDIVDDLHKLRGEPITSVTVRHHLSKLQGDGLVDTPKMRRRQTPGRPQHIYALTQQGFSHFPNNYQHLAKTLLTEIEQRLPSREVNVIIEGVASAMAKDANIPEGKLRDRLEAVVDYLNEHGYDASYEPSPQGYILCTSNCPYHSMAQEHENLCQMDMQLISKMLGVVPRMTARVSDGDDRCSYLIPMPS